MHLKMRCFSSWDRLFTIDGLAYNDEINDEKLTENMVILFQNETMGSMSNVLFQRNMLPYQDQF